MKLEQTIYTARITEFTDNAGGLLTLDPNLVQTITEGDDNPKFVTLEIEGGESNNKREWPDHVIESIAEQVNRKEPVAYQGHIAEQDDATVLPDPTAIWLKATTIIRNGHRVAVVKGYVLPTATNVRDWLKRRAVNSVSVRGEAELELVRGGKYRVRKFDLESIDWSRKNKEGMKARVVSVTAEMTDGGNVEPQEIAKLTQTDLKQHNPSLYQLVVNEGETACKSKITEMEATADAVQPELDLLGEIRKMLGIDEKASPVDALAKVMTAVTDSAKTQAKAIVNTLLAEKIEDERPRNLVQKLIGEMEPAKDQPLEDFKTEAAKKIDDILVNDEDVKAYIAEMSGSKQGRGSSGGANLGHSRKVSEMTDGKKPRENDNLREEFVTSF
jgi:hypothetical protein